MKSIYFTFSILLSILLSSCARKAGEALFDDFSNAINLVIVDSIDLEELNILNPHNIIYKRNTIVFRNLGTKQLLQFLNLKDGRIASKNILGDGPNEVSSYGIITSADPLKLHVADPTTSKILEVDIDSIWIDSSYHPRNIDMYSTKQHALVGCENERYIFRNGYFEEARFMRYDKTNCTVDFFSEYPDIEELNLLSMVEKGLVFGGTSMTADSSHLVACVHGLLDFYHLDENGGIKLINSHYYYLPQFNVNLKGRSILSFEASSPEFFFNGIKSTENSSENEDDTDKNIYNKKSNNNDNNDYIDNTNNTNKKDNLDEIDNTHILKIIYNLINKAIEEEKEKEEEEQEKEKEKEKLITIKRYQQEDGNLELIQKEEEEEEEDKNKREESNELVKFMEEEETNKREKEEEERRKKEEKEKRKKEEEERRKRDEEILRQREEEMKRLEEEKKRREEQIRKNKIKSYEISLNDLLDEINREWSDDRTNFSNKYEYKYINSMTDLFNVVNDDDSNSIRDEIIVYIFKFICDYFQSRKNYLSEIPWVELNQIYKILLKENFEGTCILRKDQLLIDCFNQLLKTYNIKKDEDDKIIEYNFNNFIKYLAEFLFRNGFFGLYIDNVIIREDENFFSFDNYIYDNTSNYISDLINIICYPVEALNFCEKEYLLKNNYHERYMNNFLKKIDMIVKSSVFKEEYKKKFYASIIEKYKSLMEMAFNKILDEVKKKNNPTFENFANFVVKIGEFYLRQQKLESRIYGLNIITQLIELFQNHNDKVLSYLKECIIKYMTKINIYNLIFGENIHEALIPRSYTLLSFLYKNKAFKPEQIKHLWNLSQDKYQTISENIITLFGRLLPEFSTNDSNAILKIVSEMNLSEVNEITLKLLENFFNSNEKNEKLYNILYKLSDELILNEGLAKNIIIKSRSILVKLLFNQNYTKELINIIKRSIFNIGKNYLVNTSLSLLNLILEEFSKNQGSSEIKKIFMEINPNIHNIELLIQYLEKKGDLFSVLFVNILDNAKLIQFLLEETKNLKQLANNTENFDAELAIKLDEIYKKYINPENGYYHNYGLTDINQPEQIINNNAIRQVASNQLDKTQSTEKSLNEGMLENEEEIDGNNLNIINNFEDIFNTEEDNWDFEINPEKYFKNIFKEYILFIKNISSKNSNIFNSEEELIECVYNQFEFPFNNKNYYQNINDILDIITSFCVMGKIQIQIGYLDFFYQIKIKNGAKSPEKILYYKFLNNILKKQLENKNIILLSDKVLKELILEKNTKYDSVSINQLPYEAFEFFKQFFIYFNQKFGNISYSNSAKKINSIQRYDLLVGLQILENYFIYSKDDKIYNESLEILTNILTISAESLENRRKMLDKIFEFLKKNIEKVKSDNEIKNYIIRELKLLFIINSTKVTNIYDPNLPENNIEIYIQNNFSHPNEDLEPYKVFKGIKIKELRSKILNDILLSEKSQKQHNQISSVLNMHFSNDYFKQDIDKQGFILIFKNQVLQEENDIALSDYNVEDKDIIIIQSGSGDNNNNNNNGMEIPEEKLKEGVEQICGVFGNMYEEEIIKLAIKKNNGNVDDSIMYLTDENHIELLKKEIEQNKKKLQEQKSKNVVKKEEYIIPLEEDKINLLFDLLNEEDNLINDEIWKLFSQIKYPDSIINKATGLELMTVISEPNLYKMLLNLKLVNSLVFEDKFCKYNQIPIEIKSNWLSKFITNESFVSAILKKLNDIGENQPEIEEKNDLELFQVKFQIISIFTNWFHNIFVNIVNIVNNKYIKNMIKDIAQCKEFSLHNNKNISIINENVKNNNINNGNNNANNANNGNGNDNVNEQINQIEMINEKEAKGFIKILNDNNVVQIFYKLLKAALKYNKNNKDTIESILEILLIYFSINKEAIKILLEEEKKENCFLQMITSDKNKILRILGNDFIKILVKNLNNFEIKHKKEKSKEINKKEEKEDEKKEQNEENKNDEEKENKEEHKENKNEVKEENKENKEIEDKNEEEECEEVIINNNNLQEEKCVRRGVYHERNKKEEEGGIAPPVSKKVEEKEEKEEKEEEEEIEEDIQDPKNLLNYILLSLYKDKIICEELYSQEFYMIFGFLLSFKEIKFSEEEKESFIMSDIISYLINTIYNDCKLDGEEFIEKKSKIMYNIYILTLCNRYYSSLIKYYLEKNEKEDLIKIIYECLFEVNNSTKSITSYKFNWDDLRKHSYNLITNIITLDNKYLIQVLPKILNHHNKFLQKKQGISTDFKLRDPAHDKLIGLRNFGATCYLNSLFQQMFMNPLFAKDLYNFNIDKKLSDGSLENSVIYNMQLGFANLRYSCLEVYPLYQFIKSFKKAFNGGPIQFGVQQDSDEFLTILCDELEKEAKKYGKENFLEKSFKGKIANEIVSLDKENPYYSQTDEDFYRVTLDIKGHQTLEEALDAYIKGEILDGENQYYVEKYKKKLSIRKSSSLKKLGNQIIIHLKRFEFDFVTFTNKKLNDYLVFPNEINFKKWTRAYLRSRDPNLKPELLNITEEEKENLDEDKMNYVLTGILIHSGSSLQSGHYYSLIMDQESGQWYQFNDNVINKFNIERDLEKECFGNKNNNNNGGEQFGRTAYLLFYTKKDLFRNEKIINEININESILNEVYKENLNYLRIKTFTNSQYQDFLFKFAESASLFLKNNNISEKEHSINKYYRNKAKLLCELIKMNKKEKDKEKHEENKINEDKKEEKDKIEEEIENDIKDFVIPDNIEELISKINSDNNKVNNELDIKKNYSFKKVIKLLIYYAFDIVVQYFDNNVKITMFLNTLNVYISSDKIYSISILKLMEKNIDFLADMIFKCGSRSQDMMNVNKEIYDLFLNLFKNSYEYEKGTLKILSKKFKYITKDKDSNKYEIAEEYESCLIRFVQKFFCNNLEKCRKEYALDLMFLHLFYFCVSTFPEISFPLENILILLISFITNNSLNNPIFKSKENPNFFMGGNKGFKANDNYAKIFIEIILHSINNGMYTKKKLSQYFKGVNPPVNNNSEINQDINFDLYPKLPHDINIIFDQEFFINFVYSNNCPVELISHLCYEDENISVKMLTEINSYLRHTNSRINTMEIVFTKICNVFSINDSLTELRLETLFQLNSNNPGTIPLFDYYYNERQTEFFLDFLFNLSSVMYQYDAISEYFIKNKSKIQWIYGYFIDLKEEGFLSDIYNKVNSYHPEFIQIIEEGLINRLNFIPAEQNNNAVGQNQNDFMDDDDGFSIM